MTLELVFKIGFAALLTAVVATVIALFAQNKIAQLIARLIMVVATLALTTYIAMRWVESGRAPFSNMFESLVLFSWAALLTGLVFQAWLKLPAIDPAAAIIALLSLAYASFEESAIRPLMPALQSNWLTTHVMTCFFGYVAFGIAFLLAVGYLFLLYFSEEGVDAENPTLEMVLGKLVAFGFLFLSLGIATGAVWANSAWGTYWSWDPKETWSLVTWLVYAVFLHLRYTRSWSGKRMAWMSVAGFTCVLFTYFGVNYLPIFKGLHSYA